MKKILPLALIVVGMASNAQSEKKEPPPPPPKPKEEVKYKVVKDEKEKVSPPKIVYEKTKMKEPPPPPPKPKEEEIKRPPVIMVSGKMADEFYKRNPSVSEISRQGNIISLRKMDGVTENYDMNNKEEDKSFTDKYGKSPIPSPPPPPKKKAKA